MLLDRTTRKLIIAGILFLMIAAALLTRDSFNVTTGERQRVITRHDNPMIYWGTEAGVLIVAISFFSFGIYRSRKK